MLDNFLQGPQREPIYELINSREDIPSLYSYSPRGPQKFYFKKYGARPPRIPSKEFKGKPKSLDKILERRNHSSRFDKKLRTKKVYRTDYF